MGFIAGKIAWILIQPLSMVFLLLLGGMVLGWFGMKKLKGILTFLAALLLFVALFTSTGSWALARLEDHFPRPAGDPAAVGCIIILGGAIDAPVTAGRGGFEMTQAADRFVEGLRLAQKYPMARILVSGGDGSLSGRQDGDGIVSRAYFSAFGIDTSRLVQETQSRSTIENAAMTAEFLAREKLEGCLLVTSAYHMPRSIGLFEKLGVNVTPWPVDYRTPGQVAFGFDFTQPSLNAQLATTAAREWTAILMAYVTGHTLHLLPK
jgi:uncharacterized SAM-binding protein YcdF (DUF218 family)